jgi:RNA-directed DNA polymerase
MTAAMLVLEPIFEADLPPELYAYRAGHNAQQAAVEVEELLFRGHPEVMRQSPPMSRRFTNSAGRWR